MIETVALEPTGPALLPAAAARAMLERIIQEAGGAEPASTFLGRFAAALEHASASGIIDVSITLVDPSPEADKVDPRTWLDFMAHDICVRMVADVIDLLEDAGFHVAYEARIVSANDAAAAFASLES